jgi:hypothetical protein
MAAQVFGITPIRNPVRIDALIDFHAQKEISGQEVIDDIHVLE